MDVAPPTTAPAFAEEKRESLSDIFPTRQIGCSPEDNLKARTQPINSDARGHPRVTGFDSSKRLVDSIKYVTEIMLKSDLSMLRPLSI